MSPNPAPDSPAAEPAARPSAAAEPPAAEPPAGGLAGLLAHWGFTAAGWRDNRRGEWWLLGQILLLVALLLPPWPAVFPLPVAWPLALRLLGAGLLLAAVVEAVRALRALGGALTPLPQPLSGAGLITTGPYALCRHPLYRQILVGALGMALLRASALHLGLLLALALLLGGKARREERGLEALHPDYVAYRAATPAIVPHLPWLDWR